MSFAAFTWDRSVRRSANHHPLNTLLMQGFWRLFGSSEVSLRLPNVLAHGTYLAFTLALASRFPHAGVKISGFILLNLNPLALNYFAVARGYGLALAFQVASLYFLAAAHQETAHRLLRAHASDRSARRTAGRLRPALAMAAAFAAGATLFVLMMPILPYVGRMAFIAAAALVPFVAPCATAIVARARNDGSAYANDDKENAFEGRLYFSLGAASLALVSNYSFLNYFAPLLCVGSWRLVHGAPIWGARAERVAARLAVYFGAGALLCAVLVSIFSLKRADQLYLGGTASFMSDTVYDLVRCSLDSEIYSPTRAAGLSALIAALFVVLLVGEVRRVISGSNDRLLTTLWWLLSAGVALPILQHYLFHTPFPVARTALYLLPLFALVVVLELHLLVQRIASHQRQALVAILLSLTSAAVGWNWYRGYQHTPCTWMEDNHNIEVLETINRDRKERSSKQPITLHSDRLFEPSLNFYRVARSYTWLRQVPHPKRPSRTAPAPVVTGVGADYIYIYERDMNLLRVTHVVLSSYDDIGTVVLRVGEDGR